MLNNSFIVWEMANALNLQKKDSEYNFKLQAIKKLFFRLPIAMGAKIAVYKI